jgi:hypothetical protein
MSKIKKSEKDKEADCIINRFSQTSYAKYMFYFHKLGILVLFISLILVLNVENISSNILFSFLFWFFIVTIFVFEPIIALFKGVTFPISLISRPLQAMPMYLVKFNRPLQFYLDIILKIAIALLAIVWAWFV